MDAQTKREERTRWQRLSVGVAVVFLAAVLVCLQVPVASMASKALADGNEPIEAQLANDITVDVPLAFENAYLVYEDQVIAEPATKVTVPRNMPFEFKAVPDTDFQIESVKAIINDAEVILTADADGLYKLTASDILSTSQVIIRAIAVPAAINEPENAGVEASKTVEVTEATATTNDQDDEGLAAQSVSDASQSAASASAASASASSASASAEAANSEEPALGAASVVEPESNQLVAADIPTETAITSDNADVEVVIYKSSDERAAGISPLSPDYEIGISETLYGAVRFDFHPGYGPTSGRLNYTYTLPSNIITANKLPATLYDNSGNVAGTWDITNNIVHFNYLESWALAHPNGGGSFYFDFTLDQEQTQAGSSNLFSFPGASETITINVKGHEISGTKTNSDIKDGVVTYTVALNAEDNFDTFVFSDHIEKNLRYVPGSFEIVRGDVRQALTVTITNNEDGTQDAVAEPFAVEEGNFTITYKATIDQAAYDALKEGKKLEADTKNTATWEYGNEGDDPQIGTAFSTVSISKDIISKSAPGGVTNGDQLQWKIKINPSDKMKTDVSGFTVTDTLKAGMKYSGTFQVLDSAGNVLHNGTIDEGATSFSYTFPENSGAKKYYIVYNTTILDVTKVQDFTNYAEVTPGGSKSTKTFHFEPGTGEGEGPAPEVSKAVADESHADSDGIVSWHSTLTSDVYPDPEQESGVVLQYFDSVEQWDQAAGKPKPDSERTNLSIFRDGGTKYEYYKIWFASEPRLSAGGVDLVKGVDYQFDGSINDGFKSLYGFCSWKPNFAGDTVPVAFRIRFILDSDTMKSVVENKTNIDIYYETQCDGSIQKYENEGRARIVKGSEETYGKSVFAYYTLKGQSTVQKTGSMRWDADRGKYVAKWEITANRSGGNSYVNELTSPYLTFRDTLPDGMRVVRDSVKITAVQPGENGGAAREHNVPFTLTQENNVATMIADLSRASSDGSQPPFYDAESGSYKAWVKLSFETELDSSAIVHDGTKQTLSNTATVYSGDLPLGTGRTMVYYTDTIVKKVGKQDDGEQFVHYTITVNELGQKLGTENGQTEINLTDMLDYRTTVVLSSIKVTDLKTNEDITGECTVTLNNEEKDTQGHDTSAFTVNVPDQRALKIEYYVKLSGNPGSSYQITNKATLEGISTNQSQVTKKFKVNHADASVYGSNTVISITKTDSSNVVDASLRLQGAKFELYLVDMSKLPAGKEYTDEQLANASTLVNTVYTDETGSAVLYDETTRALQYDTLYYFKEVEAPNNYAIDDPKPHFVMTQGSNYSTQYQLALSHGITPTPNTTYNVTDTRKTSALLKAEKVLEHGTLRANAFSFELREGDKVIETVKNKADGTVSFSNIVYDAPGTHTYTIREVVSENADSSITYDRHVATVVVTVENDGEGSYVATAEYADGGDKAVFTNAFNATAKLNVKAQKTYNGTRTLRGNDFIFELYEGDSLLEQKANDATGNVEFTTLTYQSDANPQTDPKHAFGTHTYRLVEYRPTGVTADNPVRNGITYDVTEHEFTVNVTQGADGAAVVTYEDDPSDGITFAESENGPTITGAFTNSYKATGSIVLTAKKVLDGAEPGSERFRFVLTDSDGNTVDDGATNANDGSVTFKEITYTHAGTYTYTITEAHPADAVQNADGDWVYGGRTYDGHGVKVTVKVTDNKLGKLIPVATYGDGSQTTATFENKTAKPVDFELKATKAMDGRKFLPRDRFTFELTGSGDAPMPVDAVDGVVTKDVVPTSDVAAEAVFGTVSLDINDIGKTYTYTVREVLPEGVDTTNPVANGITYDPYAHHIEVTVKGNADGTIGYDVVYDDGKQTGGLTITNTYAAEGSIQLHATKTLTGRAQPIQQGEFRFFVTSDRDNNEYTASNDANGNVTFNIDGFTLSDVDKTYTYTIREEKGGFDFITYDAASYDVKVTVSENGDGTLGFTYDYGKAAPAPAFKNEYKPEPTSVQLTAHKALVGGTLEGGEFSFTLKGGPYDADTSQTTYVTDLTAKNDNKGKVTFDEIDYNAAGTYRYEVAEVVPAGSTDNEDGTFTGPDGIVYDGNVHIVMVDVTDNNAGKLERTITYEGDDEGVSFGNIALARTGFEFDKYCFGGVGAFDFTMAPADKDGNLREGEAVDYSSAATIVDDGKAAFRATVQNGAFSGGVAKIVFPEISFTADGEYHYLVWEEEPSNSSVVADEARYLVHVNVEGGQVASTTYEVIYDGENLGATDDLSFYNNKSVSLGFDSLSAQSYTEQAQRASVYPKARKYLNGSADLLVGGEFSFELVDAQTGEVVASAVNDETGEVAFFDEESSLGLAFGEPGTYVYCVREVAGSEVGMMYDDTVVTLIVTVEQTDEGLVATTAYSCDGDEASFYNVKEGVDVTVQKVSRYGGEGLVDCTYALWMASPSGDVMIAEAVSDADGYITFKDVALMAGQRYYFKEVAAPAGHTVDPYRTAYFSLNAAGDELVLVEETSADGWHSATEK